MDIKKIKLRKEVKIGLYFVIELLFTVAMLLYLNSLKETYLSMTIYDEFLYSILQMGAIMLIWFVGPMLNRIVLFIYNSLIAIYFVSQQIYFDAFSQYYRFNTAISLQNEVKGVSESVMEFIKPEHYEPFIHLGLICVVFVVLYFLLQRNCFKLRYRLIYKVAILGLIFPIQDTYAKFNEAILETKYQEDVFQLNKTDYYIYTVMPNINQFVDTFGLITFAHRDAVSLNENTVFLAEDYDRITDFLATLPEQTSNEMTGIFENKNVLFVQAESYMNVMNDPDLTPTLYKMKTEGINIKNFNTPLLDGSTSDTEFMANTSIIPNSDGYAVAYKYPYNTFPTTLPSLFNEGGYNTNAFHNNYGTYYNRTVLFPNFGYSTYWNPMDLGKEDETSDKELMDVMQWILSEYDSHYMAYWITYSGHQPYDLDSVGVEEEYVTKIKEKYPELNDGYVSYWAKNMDLDKGLEEFVKILDWQGELDNWVFVIFGDHYVKGLDFSSSGEFYSQTNLTYELDDMYTDLYIYNSAIDPVEYEKVATTLDLLPTIANMFNFPIEQGTTLGRDIFDITYEGFHMSEIGAWKTDHFSYDILTGKIYEIDEGYSEEEAQKEIEYYSTLNEMAKLILKFDYFKPREE